MQMDSSESKKCLQIYSLSVVHVTSIKSFEKVRRPHGDKWCVEMSLLLPIAWMRKERKETEAIA